MAKVNELVLCETRQSRTGKMNKRRFSHESNAMKFGDRGKKVCTKCRKVMGDKNEIGEIRAQGSQFSPADLTLFLGLEKNDRVWNTLLGTVPNF